MAVKDLNAESLGHYVQSGKVVLVDFWASWCGPCKMFSPVYETVSEQYPAVVFGKVDVMANQDLAEQFKIRSIPKICVIVDGQLVGERYGAMNAEQLSEFIEEHLPQ